MESNGSLAITDWLNITSFLGIFIHICDVLLELVAIVLKPNMIDTASCFVSDLILKYRT